MTNLLFKQSSLQEFWQIFNSREIEKLRCEQGVLFECPVPQFDTHVINVFAPKDHVLWNLGLYPRFRSSEHVFFQRYLEPGVVDSVDRTLKQVAKSAGFPARSNFSIFMMGGWMQRMEFFPRPLRVQTLDSMHRHFSIVVPNSRLEAVREHFCLQVRTFGDTAFMRYGEALPEPSLIDDLISTKEWILLGQSPEYLEETERNFLYDEAERHVANPTALHGLIGRLDPRWGIRGMVRLLGVVDEKNVRYVDLDRFGSVLRFHLSVALRIDSLQTLASKVFHDMGLSASIYPDGIKEELLKQISERLLPYKAIVDFDLDLCDAQPIAPPSIW